MSQFLKILISFKEHNLSNIYCFRQQPCVKLWDKQYTLHNFFFNEFKKFQIFFVVGSFNWTSSYWISDKVITKREMNGVSNNERHIYNLWYSIFSLQLIYSRYIYVHIIFRYNLEVKGKFQNFLFEKALCVKVMLYQ